MQSRCYSCSPANAAGAAVAPAGRTAQLSHCAALSLGLGTRAGALRRRLRRRGAGGIREPAGNRIWYF